MNEETPRHKTPQYVCDVMRVRAAHNRMARVELECEKFLSAVKQWGCKDTLYVDWLFCDRLPTDRVLYLDGPFDFAYDLLWWSIDSYGVTDENVEGLPWYIPPKTLPKIAYKALRSCYGWEFAVENNIPVRGLTYALPQRDVRSYSELENPFVPLVSIMEHGCYVTNFPTGEQPSIRVAITR